MKFEVDADALVGTGTWFEIESSDPDRAARVIDALNSQLMSVTHEGEILTDEEFEANELLPADQIKYTPNYISDVYRGVTGPMVVIDVKDLPADIFRPGWIRVLRDGMEAAGLEWVRVRNPTEYTNDRWFPDS